MQITYNIDLLRGGGSLGNSSEVMGLKYERILQPSKGNSIDALGASLVALIIDTIPCLMTFFKKLIVTMLIL